MAEKKHKKKHPHKIITTRAQDGTFGHEHMDEAGGPPVFAGTSQNLDDVKQHMDDHFGGDAEGGGDPEAAAAEPGGGEGEPA